jgi:hypothetical protein
MMVYESPSLAVRLILAHAGVMRLPSPQLAPGGLSVVHLLERNWPGLDEGDLLGQKKATLAVVVS